MEHLHVIKMGLSDHLYYVFVHAYRSCSSFHVLRVECSSLSVSWFLKSFTYESAAVCPLKLNTEQFSPWQLAKPHCSKGKIAFKY